MDQFFVEDGSNNLLFHYEDVEAPPTAPESYGLSKPPKPVKAKLEIIDKCDISLTGICIYFTRNPAVAIETANIAQVKIIFFSFLLQKSIKHCYKI